MLVQASRRLYRRTLESLPVADRFSVIQYLRRLRRSRGRADGDSPAPAAAPPSAPPMPSSASDERLRLHGYAVNEDQARALSRILEALELAVSPRELIAHLDAVMTASDVAHVIALLTFAASRHRFDAGPGREGGVRRAADRRSLLAEPRRRLNILFITGEFPNPVHGGGGRVADFIKAMSRDHDIYLYAGYEEGDAEAYETLRPHCRRIELASYQEFDGNPAKVSQVIAGVPIDIVHYEWPRALTNFRRAWGTSHVFTFMEAVSLRVRMEMAGSAPLSPEWLRLMLRLIRTLKVEIVDADQADELIVVTERDGEFYARLNPGRDYHVLNHGVDFESFCLPDVAPERHTLTFVGNFRHHPNEDAMRFFFGRVFGLIRAQVPDVRLYVVGADPTDAVRAHHDGQHVVVTGTVDDIRPYIQRAAVCLAPLVSGAGLRGKLIQYAALKRVCVATSNASAGLRFEDGRDIVLADDPATFAERVVWLLRDPAVARTMSLAAYRTAGAYYTRAQLTQQLYGIYERIDHGPWDVGVA